MATSHYKLKRKFWNGRVLLPVGHVEPFEEGKQPTSAKRVAEPELAVEPTEPAKPAPVKGK